MGCCRIFPFSIGFFSFVLSLQAQVWDSPILPDRGNVIEELIPEGWHFLDSATGDLTGDSLDDLLLVIEKDSIVKVMKKGVETEYEREGQPRLLLIYTGRPEGGYRFSVCAEDVVLWSNEGGMMGDPFEGLEVNNGSFTLSFYGGSSYRWGSSLRFRYQGDDWYLIGVSSFSLDLSDGVYTRTECDLPTGDLEIVRGIDFRVDCVPCEDCSACTPCNECDDCHECREPEPVIECTNIGKWELPRLEEFDPVNWNDPTW